MNDPNKKKETLPFWKKYLTPLGHTLLDVGGMIPGVGAGADALNASWYASKGDTVNAALSTAAIVPGLGQVATGTKYLNKLRKTFGFGANIKKAKSIVKETPYIPKKLPNEGLINPEKLTSVINRSKSKGVIYDKNIGAGSDFVWKSNMFRKMPSISGRKMVDVNPGGGIPPQRFYESTGLAGKKLADGSTSKGTWVPLEGFGVNAGIKDWFIKTKGWDQGYGSSTFKNMGNLIKKYGY